MNRLQPVILLKVEFYPPGNRTNVSHQTGKLKKNGLKSTERDGICFSGDFSRKRMDLQLRD